MKEKDILRYGFKQIQEGCNSLSSQIFDIKRGREDISTKSHKPFK